MRISRWHVLLPVAAVVLLSALVRSRMIREGAVGHEVDMRLPGDRLIPSPNLTATRAITIDASPEAVWPWIVQLGQGRGGFYSYDRLENLLGCDIHSADHVVAQWPSIEIGSQVRLAPEVALTVAVVEPLRALVLRGSVSMRRAPAPYDFTWAFVIAAEPDGSARLVVRERYRYLSPWAPVLVEPVALVSSAMTRRMLLGIKERVERSTAFPDLGLLGPASGR